MNATGLVLWLTGASGAVAGAVPRHAALDLGTGAARPDLPLHPLVVRRRLPDDWLKLGKPSSPRGRCCEAAVLWPSLAAAGCAVGAGLGGRRPTWGGGRAARHRNAVPRGGRGAACCWLVGSRPQILHDLAAVAHLCNTLVFFGVSQPCLGVSLPGVGQAIVLSVSRVSLARQQRPAVGVHLAFQPPVIRHHLREPVRRASLLEPESKQLLSVCSKELAEAARELLRLLHGGEEPPVVGRVRPVGRHPVVGSCV